MASKVPMLLIGLVLVACAAREQAPAQKMIADIETAVNAALPDAANYVPDQLKEVQKKLGEFKADYDKEDYKDVVGGAPALLSTAQGLASAAEAKKSLIAKGFNDQWTLLSSTLPAHAAAIQSRVDFFSKPANKKLGSGVDLDAVRSGINHAAATWAHAQDAFAAGTVPEAVMMAKSAGTEYDALAASMKLDFTEPAAVKDTAP